MEVNAMRQVLGEKGVDIWKKASGIDQRRVLPFEEQKSMSKETTFEQDTIDIQLLRSVLLAMVDELAFELRQNRKLTSCVSVKIRYSNFDTHTRHITISFTYIYRSFDIIR